MESRKMPVEQYEFYSDSDYLFQISHLLILILDLVFGRYQLSIVASQFPSLYLDVSVNRRIRSPAFDVFPFCNLPMTPGL